MMTNWSTVGMQHVLPQSLTTDTFKRVTCNYLGHSGIFTAKLVCTSMTSQSIVAMFPKQNISKYYHLNAIK